MKVRVSIGTLSILGLMRVKMLAAPTTAYFLQYSERGCLGGCAYCAQSHTNCCKKDYLSRVLWPKCEIEQVVPLLGSNSRFKRVCLQTVIKYNFLKDIINFLEMLRASKVDIPLSVAVTPLPERALRNLKALGVERVGIGLDVATPELFLRMKKPYSWDTYWRFIDKALRIFEGVTVHLIFGLGEKVTDFISIMAMIISKGADVALFPYTPIKGLRVSKRPELEVYRVIQAVRYFLVKGYSIDDLIRFEGSRLTVTNIIYDVPLEAFLTSGCPDCNRPFYTESPLKIYNYPSLSLLIRDKSKVYEQLRRGVLKLVDKQ